MVDISTLLLGLSSALVLYVAGIRNTTIWVHFLRFIVLQLAVSFSVLIHRVLWGNLSAQSGD